MLMPVEKSKLPQKPLIPSLFQRSPTDYFEILDGIMPIANGIGLNICIIGITTVAQVK
jgi:hypothetical protein